VKILFVADVIGSPGRRVVTQLLRLVRKDVGADAVILNGENSAGGFGITPDTVREFLELGVDVITTGNHVWDKKEILPSSTASRASCAPPTTRLPIRGAGTRWSRWGRSGWR
jgi:calcineurin-like phosphoesterase